MVKAFDPLPRKMERGQSSVLTFALGAQELPRKTQTPEQPLLRGSAYCPEASRAETAILEAQAVMPFVSAMKAVSRLISSSLKVVSRKPD